MYEEEAMCYKLIDEDFSVKHLKRGDSVASKRPSCVKASGEVVVFLSSLKVGSYLLKIVDAGLDVLKMNMFAGGRIERRKFPKYYIQKHGVNNLYKFNLDSRTRLIYTLVAEETGIAVVVLEILDHKKYEERFGYS
jgi:hypothetical protein